MYKILFLILIIFIPFQGNAYPIDGFEYTGIDRLLFQYRIYKDSNRNSTIPEGAMVMMDGIKLNLINYEAGWPEEDKELESQLRNIFRYLEPQYSISLMDISDPSNIRYAGLKDKVGYQPGSVAKIIAALSLFDQLYEVYDGEWQDIHGILYTKRVIGHDYVETDHHTIPLYDIENDVYSNRPAIRSDEFSLYEWLDHMFTKSSNAAASVVMREMLLVHILDKYYECANDDEMQKAIADAGKGVMGAISEDLTNCALEKIGITPDEFKLGGLFTSGAERHVGRSGGSIGTTLGLMKFMFALELGEILDKKVSLEIKRLMYLTDRRIRYAASYSIKKDAVYFKSGSLYSFMDEPGFVRRKYAGNRYNYMNSVAIVEKQDSTSRKYMVALMSNVLRKNSVGEHYALAKRIDDLITNLN